MSKNLFFAGLIFAASGLLSPPLALAAGLAFGFTFEHPYHLDAKRLSKLLLQVSVVGLGFGMNLRAACRTQRPDIHGSRHYVCDAAGMGMGNCFR